MRRLSAILFMILFLPIVYSFDISQTAIHIPTASNHQHWKLIISSYNGRFSTTPIGDFIHSMIENDTVFLTFVMDKPDIYSGKLIVKDDVNSKFIPIVVDYSNTQELIPTLNLLHLSNIVQPNGTLPLDIKFSTENPIYDANLSYVVKDLYGNVLFRDDVIADIFNGLELRKHITLPNLSQGNYVVGVIISWNNFTVVSSRFFYVGSMVKKQKAYFDFTIIFYIVAAILFFLLLYIFVKRRPFIKFNTRDTSHITLTSPKISSDNLKDLYRQEVERLKKFKK